MHSLIALSADFCSSTVSCLPVRPGGFLSGLLVSRVYSGTYGYLTAAELAGFAGMTAGGALMGTRGGFPTGRRHWRPGSYCSGQCPRKPGKPLPQFTSQRLSPFFIRVYTIFGSCPIAVNDQHAI